MDFKKVVKVCTDFAVKNEATITCCCTCWEVVLSVNQQSDASDRQVCLKYGECGSWCVNSMKNGVVEHFTVVTNQEQLLDTLKLEFVAMSTKTAANLLNARLADVEAVIEKHTGMLQSILELLKGKVTEEWAEGEIGESSTQSTDETHEKCVSDEPAKDTSGAQ